MPEIQIRPAAKDDISTLVALDHTITTEYVWQMDIKYDNDMERIAAKFQKVQLPRKVNLNYPKPVDLLLQDWQHFSGLLLASISAQPVAYISLIIDRITQAVWVLDLVVDKDFRRQGIGSALLLASAEFAHENGSSTLILEMQPRNGPAIALAQKMGFDFCGFNDHYYPVNEIAVFFRKSF